MSISTPKSAPPQTPATVERLITATQFTMLRHGYARTTIDDICAHAAVSKGSFFHHFPSKEAICRAGVDAWGEMGMRLYSVAWSDPHTDPLEQCHRLLDIMISFTATRDEPCLCLVGMMSQELALSNPEMREVCAGHLTVWTQMVAQMLTQAKRLHPPARDFDPEHVGWMLNSLWQGSMLIAKTRKKPRMIVDNLELARSHITSLFNLPREEIGTPS
jgi:TetR/AcrR family transcriptional repressor of nem operon